MAEIYPFQAYRYNADKVRLEDVLTQPYDKITPAMQEGYYRRSPFNLVRVELGKDDGEDSSSQGQDKYARAAGCLKQWRAQGILARDKEPSIYAYEQRFQAPGSGDWRFRRGFIGLLKLADYNEGVVFRHEQTLSKPKSDRMKLLNATQTLTGQIFMLYSDPEKLVDGLIWAAVEGQEPTASMTDEYGVRHSAWKLSDSALLGQVQRAMAAKKLIIADGHHRYETSLAYRDSRRKDDPDGSTAVAPYELVMSTFVNTESEGLVILPTHRVVSGLNGFAPGSFLERASEYYSVEKVAQAENAEAVLAAVSEPGKKVTLAACLRDGCYLLTADKQKIDTVLAQMSPEQRALDVVQLHEVLLGRVLGITPEQVRQQAHVSYYRSAEEAMQQLQSGADAVFLINAVSMEQLKQVAFSGQVMPQKSTDFYPKLLSGITMYAME